MKHSLSILVYSINYFPERISTGKYTSEMAAWLAAAGHQVNVVTAPPYYPDWHVWEGYWGLRYCREKIENVKVVRCPLWVPEKPRALSRILHLLSFVATSGPVFLRQVFRQRPDIILVIQPYTFAGPIARIGGWLTECVTWVHVQDFEIDAAFGLGFLGKGLLQRMANKYESLLLRSFHHVSTISRRMEDKLADKGIDPGRQVLFPNWVDTHYIRPLVGISPLRQELGLRENEFVALYSGNMGVKQGLELLIHAADYLQHEPNLVFLLCGDGAVRPQLEKQAQGMANVRFAPLQPYERLNELLAVADLHLLPQRADAADIVMPSKLSGMMASGRPVLASAAPGTEVAKAVEHGGLVVPPEDIQAFAEAIRRLIADPEKRLAMGQAARIYAEQNWDKSVVLKQFERVFSAAVKRFYLLSTEENK